MKNNLLVFSLLILMVSNFNLVTAAPGDITRVSLPALGSEANGDSNYPSISANGLFVAFESDASNLVAGDTNGVRDIFVHDRQTGSNTLVSVHSSGLQGNGNSEEAAISSNGRYVAFQLNASNLVAEDSNGKMDIFVHDRNTGETSRVSVATGGGQTNGDSLYPAISADGRYIAFESFGTNLVANDTNTFRDVFIHDQDTKTTIRVSVADGGAQSNGISLSPSLSGDGKFVAFTSTASNLVAEDTNGKNDIFVNEWSKNKLTRVSIPGYSGGESNGDSYGASISADGNRVVFYSYASNLVLDDTNKKTDIFMFDFLNPETIRVSLTPDSLQANNDSGSPAISPDGYFLAFDSIANDLVIGDENGTSDVFLHIFGSGTELVSKTSSSTPGNAGSYYPSISEYGNSVAFVSAATDLVAGDTNGFEDVFVFDRILGVLTRISVPSTQSQASVSPSISADGRYVAFVSAASNLVMGDSNGKSDVFVHDRQSVTNTLVSVRTDGFQANSDSFNPTISRDGRYVVFHSDANNLVTGDSNIRSDVFVHDRQMSTTIRVSVNSVGNQADDVSQSASISFDGRFVAFESYASNLVTDDNNGVADIFVRDFLNGTTTRLSVDSNKVQSNGPSHRPSISGNGLFVAFESEATNLVSGDEYNVIDIFVRDIEAGTTSRVSIANNGDESNWHSSYPSISGDGRFIAFASGATNLVVGDTNGISDIFVHDRQSGTTKIIPFNLAPGATPNMARIPSISANGNVVAFASLYWVLPEHYLSEFITIHNINSGKTNRIECDDVHNPCYLSLSGDGRFVAFQSTFPFVAGDMNSVSDIFVYENEVITNVFLPLLLR